MSTSGERGRRLHVLRSLTGPRGLTLTVERGSGLLTVTSRDGAAIYAGDDLDAAIEAVRAVPLRGSLLLLVFRSRRATLRHWPRSTIRCLPSIGPLLRLRLGPRSESVVGAWRKVFRGSLAQSIP